MRQASCIRILVVVVLVLFLAGCEGTFAYLPGTGKPTVEAAPAATGEALPAAAAPAMAPSPNLAQQVQTLEARVQQLEARLAELEARQAAPALPGAGTRREAPKAKGAAAGPSAAYPKAPTATDKTYSEGLRLYQSKKYGEARSKFHQYLKDHPQGPKAPEARYHLADSFYQEGKYQEAAVEFNKMVTQYPQSILAPAALLRQALAYKQQHRDSAYQNTLKKLAQAYPNSPEAKEGQKWLQEGKKEPKKEPAR